MLLDTSGLLALLLVREPQHADANLLFSSAGRCITHNYVLAELVALGTSRGVPRERLIEFVTSLPFVPEIELVWVDEKLHNRALLLLRDRADKTYSLCDAVSFLLMRDLGISEALTTDGHFEQEGMKRLLSP